MMPWEKPPVQDDLEIPAILKRDANNVAPYMRVKQPKDKKPEHPWNEK